MPKYIKTEDNIYEVVQENMKFRDKLYYFVYTKKHMGEYNIRGLIPVDQAIKTADTLEELCDEFVYYMSKEEHPKRCCKNVREHWCCDDYNLPLLTNEEILTIKGGVWTNKGFIFKAEMNDKKELKLIYDEL